MQQQIEDNNKRQQTEFRNIQEMLLQAMKQAPIKSKDYEDIMKSNQMLSDTIKSVEDRNQRLNAKLSSLKIVQRVFKHSLSM
jgi:hypothetical protein